MPKFPATVSHSDETSRPCIIVHGGAGEIPIPRRTSCLSAVKEAAKIGYLMLLEGKSALDAVEAATRSMEDSGVLNAGRGCYLTEEGTVELDAMIMDGQTLNTGAVACVKNIANPISLARKLMTDTSHCMLAGEGALKFARKIDFPISEDPSLLISNRSQQLYLEKKSKQENLEESASSKSKDSNLQDDHKKKTETQFDEHDTVGAVAIDTNGHIAVAVSTGGTSNKMCGRVGDSPLVGSGAYANQQAGAVCTGHGESLLKVLLSRDVVYSVENGMTPRYACRKVISKMAEQTGGHGGVICLDKFGNIGLEFNTGRMVWASVTNEGFLKYGIDPGKEIMNYDSPLKKMLE